MTTRPPLKALDIYSTIAYAIGLAMREAQLDGLLTKETVTRISDRAEVLKNALVDGKIVEVSKEGTAIIRDAEPDEEAELGAEEFPFHAKSKTTLDI